MAKSYTISEAAEFLGIQEADVEDLVASGEVSFEIVDDEYRIPEDLLLKVRVDLRKTRKTKKTPPHSIMDDAEFTGYFEDFICLKLNEISKKIESSFHMHGIELNNVRKFLTKRIDMYKEPLLVLTELDSIMKKAVEKAFKELDLKGGGNVSGPQGAAEISGKAEALLEESLKKHEEVLKSLKKLENRIGGDNEKVFKTLERMWKANPANEIKNRIDGFIKNINESILERIDSIKADMAQLAKIKDKAGSAPEGGDGSLAELLEGQKRLRKSIYELNLGIKNSILDKSDDLAEILAETPKILEEMKSVIPALKDFAENKINQLDRLSKGARAAGESIDAGEAGEIMARLDEIRTALDLSGGGFLVPHVDSKLNEIRSNIEQLFIQLGNRQNKALAENITRIAIPADKINGINKQFQQLASTLSDFSASLDNSLNKINQAVDKIKKSSPGSGGGSLADEEKISKILESLDSLNIRMDETMGRSMGEAIEQLKESQDSFQNIVVNMNINSQKALTEKLTQLDRLNELIGIRDNVDEIAEQMQTFEAITADINQLVDERLQLLAGISEQLETLGGGSAGGGESSGKMAKIAEEIKKAIGEFGERFSPEFVLSQFRQIIDEQTVELRQNQDAAQKILVNLSVNSQKWLREKLEQMDLDRDTIINITDRFKSLEDLAQNLNEKLSQKLFQFESAGGQAEKISLDQGMNESLLRIQEIIATETKSLRQSVEATQKIVSGLSLSNQKVVYENLKDIELPENAVDALAQRNLQILEAVVGKVSPDRTVVSVLDDIKLLLDSMKENLNTGLLLEKMEELKSRGADEGDRDQTDISKALKDLQHQMSTQVSTRIDQIYEGIAEVLANLDTDNLVTSMGEVFIEGNELLKEHQTGIFNQILQNHNQLTEQIGRINLPDGIQLSASGGMGGGQELLPVLEKVLENSLNNFRKDLDGSQKILVNLNVNLQKQLLAKVQEIVEEQAQKGGGSSDEICGRIDVLFEEKLQELKENQETLLTLNMGIQKALKAKLDEIRENAESGSGETSRALPILERVLTDKLQQLQDSYNESAIALEKLAKSNQTLLLEKLDRIAGDLSRFSGGISLGEYLPLMQEGLAETYNFLGTLKQDLDRISKSMKGHEGVFGGGQGGSDFSSQMEETLMIKMDEDRETLRVISQRIQHIIDLVKEIYQKGSGGGHSQEIPKAFLDKLDESREMEKQLVKNLNQLQNEISRNSQKALEDETGYMKEILESVTETRQDQEQLSLKLETLSGIISALSSSIKENNAGDSSTGEIDELRGELDKTKELNGILENEKKSLQDQLKILQMSDSEGGRGIQLQSMMTEKDRLLEECYREKVDLREQLEKEKRDKYEIIQRYETEKKELIDSLALERIQREKDRAELELLRAESRKKKWW